MKQEISFLKEAIFKTHGCVGSLSATAPVKENFLGKTIWEGEIHTFQIQHASGATECYAWAEPSGSATVVLGVAPITKPRKALQAALTAKIREKIPQ